MRKNCTKDCRQWAITPPNWTKVTTHWAHFGLVHSTDLIFFRISSPNARDYSQKLGETAYKCARRCHEWSKVPPKRATGGARGPTLVRRGSRLMPFKPFQFDLIHFCALLGIFVRIS